MLFPPSLIAAFALTLIPITLTTLPLLLPTQCAFFFTALLAFRVRVASVSLPLRSRQGWWFYYTLPRLQVIRLCFCAASGLSFLSFTQVIRFRPPLLAAHFRSDLGFSGTAPAVMDVPPPHVPPQDAFPFYLPFSAFLELLSPAGPALSHYLSISPSPWSLAMFIVSRWLLLSTSLDRRLFLGCFNPRPPLPPMPFLFCLSCRMTPMPIPPFD